MALWSRERHSSTKPVPGKPDSGGLALEQLVALQGMAKLIVAEAKRLGGSALIEPASGKRVFEQRTFVGGD